MTRTVAMKGAGCWRLSLVRYASRRVRRFLFETYLNPVRVMSDEPSSFLAIPSARHSRASSG
jgi:hypothetical protein